MTSRVVGALLGAAPLLLALHACKGEEEKNTYAPPPPPIVDVAHPIQKEVTESLSYTGQVTPIASVELRARVQGFLEQMNFREGQLVRKGDLLFVIDKSQYQAAVDKATAQVAATKAALEGATNDARLAQELADQNAGPKIDAIIKAAKRDTTAAQLEADRAALVNAQLDLSFCEIRAPLEGRISETKVDVGNLVGRGDPTLLAKIVDTDPVYVNVDVSEADVIRVRELNAADTERPPDTEPGQVAPGKWREVELVIPGHERYRFMGNINYVAPELDQQTGTLRVRSVFPNPNETLSPGLFVTLSFPIKKYSTILVPDAALLSDQRGRFALVVNDKNMVEQRRVRTGERRGLLREVHEGLAPADRVVVVGVLKARPGSAVTPKVVPIDDIMPPRIDVNVEPAASAAPSSAPAPAAKPANQKPG